jgi:hypothetical protein
MRLTRCLPALALVFFLPVRADDGPAAKAPDQADVEKSREHTSCCAGEKKAKCPRAKAAAAAAAKPAAAGEANMVVTRDPETGELRPATAAEREKLLGRRPLATREHKVVTLPDGTKMVELGEDAMSYAVARRNPDGTVSRTCVEGAEAAAAARKPKAATPAPRAEER